MTKAEIAEKVREKIGGISFREALTAVDTILDGIKQSLAKGEKVSIVGFGTFRVKERRSRLGRNPKTGEQIQVPGKKVPYFKPGKEFREAVNK
ncbi:MAG: integration host factor subunit beta [bacterium]|nr:integration host factor subunit beta [bacterium]